MRRSILVCTVLLVLVIGPSVLACEYCIRKGSLDPNGGGPYSSAICWTSNSGGWSYCWGGDTDCTGSDPENTCPTAGGSGCLTMSNGETICVENPEPLVAPPAGCRGTDVQGRCAGRRASATLTMLH